MEKSTQSRLWVLPLLLVLVLGGVVALRNWQPPETLHRPREDSDAKTLGGEIVALEIDTGEGTSLEYEVPWKAGNTVRDTMAGVAGGELTFVVQGDSEGALLMELAGVANEGAGGRNWQFEVNGKWADRSFAVYELQPGDHVLWKFAGSD